MQIDREEFLRYLGWKGQETDNTFLQKLDEAAKQCLAMTAPRSVVRKFELTDNLELRGTGFFLEGSDICEHLKGCREIYLMAATVGIGAERELARLTAKSTEQALLFDTAASCAVESYADDICADLEKTCGRRLTARFSCGYGDFPLEAQKDICKILRTDTRIGVCADENCLLTPRKSITALIGITDEAAPAEKEHGCGHKCAACANRGCAFRKED